MVNIILRGQPLGERVHIVDGGEDIVHNDMFGDEVVHAAAQDVLQLLALVLLQQLLKHAVADPFLDAALGLGVKIHVGGQIAHVVGEDAHGAAVHLHHDLVDANGVHLPGLRPGEDVARLVEQLACRRVDHRLHQGQTGNSGPQGELFVELVASHRAQVIAAGVKEEVVDKGLGGVHRGRLAGTQLPVNLQQSLLVGLAGILIQRGADGGVVAEVVQNLPVRAQSHSPDEAGYGELAVFINADPKQLVGIGFVLQPGAPVGNDLTGKNGQVGFGIDLLAVIDAGGADDLGDHHALCAVDDKGAGFGHKREIAHKDFLLLQLLGLLIAQAHADLQGSGVVDVPGLALLHIIFWRFVHAEVNKAQLQGTRIVADDAHIGEHLPQSGVQEPLVGVLLNLQQVGHGHNLLMPGKVFPQGFAIILVLGHLVILICLSALPYRPAGPGGGPPICPRAQTHKGGLIISY